MTLSPTLPYPGLLLSVYPLFATLASSSLLLFHGLLTPLLSASNPIKSLACYSDTFLLTLLLQLSSNSIYLSLVRPILEYGSIIWDPSSPTLSQSLDSVQHFALKIAAKFRPSLIPSILSSFNLPSLTYRRQKAKLIFLFKLLYHYIYFPSQISHPSLPPS